MTRCNSRRTTLVGRLPILGMAILGLLAGCASGDPEPSVETAEAQDELRMPRFCGGRHGSDCGDDRVCIPFLSLGCPGPDRVGICAPRPHHCPDLDKPVCGCDGESYANLCEAARSGVVMGHKGTCEPPPPPSGCGGDDGLTCPGAGVCVEDEACEDTTASARHDSRSWRHDDEPKDPPAECTMRCECNDEGLCPRGELWDADPAVCACVPDVEEPDPCARVECPDGQQCVAGPDGSTSCQ